jgi:protein ImuB
VFLGPIPVAWLEPGPGLAASLERWGVRTAGELATLPRAGVLARLGPEGARLQAWARGEDSGPFVPVAPEEPCVEALTLDWEVTSLEALAFVLRRLLAGLAARLALRDLGVRVLDLTAGLAEGEPFRHRLVPVAPLRDPQALLRLLLVALAGLRLPAPVVCLRLEAEPAPLLPLQADLLSPPRPSPRELGETLGRLAALVGPDRVGMPVVADTHRPGTIGSAPFGLPGRTVARQAAVAALVCADAATLVARRLVPPRPATVALHDGEPVRVDADGLRGAVVARVGPWRTTGEWWADTAWAREEWDVALAGGAVYRLACDAATGAWTVEAIYD